MKLIQFLAALLMACSLPTSALARTCNFSIYIWFPQQSIDFGSQDMASALRPIDVLYAKNEPVVAYIVVGHADKSEESGGNVELLSQARAGAVAAQVLRAHPELGNVLHVFAKGSKEPIGDDPIRNRRVEIEVVCIVRGPYFDKDGHPIL